MTEQARKHRYLWCDFETTGLVAPKAKILEFAALLAADDNEGDMSIVEQYSGVLRFVEADRKGLEIDQFVESMHYQNGLWGLCSYSTSTVEDAEACMIEMIGGPATKGVMLAGNSVHFDLSFVRVHMPKLAKCLSHRVLDVTTLLSAAENWGKPIERLPTAHRALPDIQNSLEYAKQFRKLVGWLP